jgi:hypothetical protein
MAKKVEEPVLERDELGIVELKSLAKSRMPKHEVGYYVFMLNSGRAHIMKPKAIVTSKSGVKIRLRYSKDSNSIFELEQETDGVEPMLEHIMLGESNTITDASLVEYLLIHPDYGKNYVIYDGAGSAEKELEAFDEFDDVWDKVRALSLEEMKAMLMLDTGRGLSEINKIAPSEIKLALRKKSESNTKGMTELLASPLLKPIYMYNMGLTLGYIKYTKAGTVIWADSQRELCKVPANQDPAKHVARFLTQDENLGVYELLTEKING